VPALVDAPTPAVAAVYAWLDVRVFRTGDVRVTRQVLDMVASIRGTRPPAVARRGLA
jgi:dihydropteroate synthase